MSLNLPPKWNQVVPPKSDKFMAIDMITDCLSAADADGYQSHEKANWYERIDGFTIGHDGKLRIKLGGHTFRVEVIKERTNG